MAFGAHEEPVSAGNVCHQLAADSTWGTPLGVAPARLAEPIFPVPLLVMASSPAAPAHERYPPPRPHLSGDQGLRPPPPALSLVRRIIRRKQRDHACFVSQEPDLSRLRLGDPTRPHHSCIRFARHLGGHFGVQGAPIRRVEALHDFLVDDDDELAEPTEGAAGVHPEVFGDKDIGQGDAEVLDLDVLGEGNNDFLALFQGDASEEVRYSRR